MLKKNNTILFNSIKILLFTVINVFALIYNQNKNLYFYLFIFITDLIILLSLSDLFIIFKNKKMEHIYSYFGFVFFILNIFIIISFLISIMFCKVLFRSFYYTLFYDSLLFVIYISFILIFINYAKKSSLILTKTNNNHMFYKLLKDEVISIKEHNNFPNSSLELINNILDFINFNMTVISNEDSSKYEKQIAKCLNLCNEFLEDNTIDELNDVLIELDKILKRRERELSVSE